MNESIKSKKEAEQRIEELKNQQNDINKQILELQSRLPDFVDSPHNIINKKQVITNDSNIYVPTESERKHYPMKYGDLLRHHDEQHLPLFFTNELSCAIFDESYDMFKHLLKFKMQYDSSPTNRLDGHTTLYHVVFSVLEDKFKIATENTLQSPTVYFHSKEVAEQCVIWMNYIYKKG